MKCLRLILMLPLALALASCASGDLRWDNPDSTFGGSDDWGMGWYAGRVTGHIDASAYPPQGPSLYIIPPPLFDDCVVDEK